MIDNIPTSVYLNTIPILFLTVSCNFTGNLLSCKNQAIFNNNIYVKHGILFSILLITMVFTNKKTFIEKEPPEDTPFLKVTLPLLLHALAIYLIFMCITKMELKYLAVCIALVISHMFVTDYKNTYLKDSEAIAQYSNVELGLKGIFMVILLIGIGSYYLKQRADYGDKFELSKFFFGTIKCHSS